MRRLLSFKLVAVIVAGVLFSVLLPRTTYASGYFSLGEGTEENPYMVANCSQLQAIANDLDAYYKLLVNIDCDTVNFVHIGDDITPFVGNFDGNHKIIKNLTVDNYGLFREINGANIQDLTLDSLSVSGNVTNGTDGVGSLVGLARTSTISNVHVINSSVSSTSGYVGGLVGVAYSTTDIQESSFTGTVSGNGALGGFMGAGFSSGSIQNNYSRASIIIGSDPGNSAGGFAAITSNNSTQYNYTVSAIDASSAGFNPTIGGFTGLGGNGIMQNNFADTPFTSAETSIGDFMGQAAGPTINNNFYADHGHGCASNTSSPPGCTSVDTSAQPDYFKNNSSQPLSSWNFEEIWEEVNGDYPQLMGEAQFSEGTADINEDSILDSYQPYMIGVTDDENRLTIVELNADTDCTLDPAGEWVDAASYKIDDGHTPQTPNMTAFTVYCPSPGAQVLVTLTYSDLYDTTNSVLRFYNPNTNNYHTVSGATFGTRSLNGNNVTTVTYMLVDGSQNDTDGLVNGIIEDPVGIAISNIDTNSSGPSSGSSDSSSSGSPVNDDTLANTGEYIIVPMITGAIIVAISSALGSRRILRKKS